MTVKRKIEKCIRKLQFGIRDISINKAYRKRLKNSNFTIISSDCTGGQLCHDFHMRFNTPTVNFYFMANDFIVFLKNLRDFIDSGVILDCSNPNFEHPVAQLSIESESVFLYLVHYKSTSEFIKKWEERKKRILWDNLFIVMNDRNSCTYDCLQEFDKLPYENKVCFTHKEYPELKSTYYITGSEQDIELDTLSKYEHQLGIKRFYDQFDWIKWLNGTALE